VVSSIEVLREMKLTLQNRPVYVIDCNSLVSLRINYLYLGDRTNVIISQLNSGHKL
jgi:hypothetical protein